MLVLDETTYGKLLGLLNDQSVGSLNISRRSNYKGKMEKNQG